MKRFSHIALIVALAALLYGNVGDLVRISIDLIETKTEAEREIAKHENLTILTVTLKEITAGDLVYFGSDEVRYHGRMYDVASSKQMGDNLELTVLADSNEDGLISELEEHLEQWLVAHAKPHKRSNLKGFSVFKVYLPSTALALQCNTVSNRFFPPLVVATISVVLPVAENPPSLLHA